MVLGSHGEAQGGWSALKVTVGGLEFVLSAHVCLFSSRWGEKRGMWY